MDQKTIEEIVYSLDADDLQDFAINHALDLGILQNQHATLQAENAELREAIGYVINMENNLNEDDILYAIKMCKQALTRPPEGKP